MRHGLLYCLSIVLVALPAHGQAVRNEAERSPIELVVQEGHSGAVRDLDYCAANGLLLSCSEDRSIKLWNLQGKLLRTFHGNTEPVTAVRFLPDGNRFVAASTDGTVSLWDALGRRLWTHVMEEGAYRLPVSVLAVSPDGELIAADRGHEIVLLDSSGNTVPVKGGSALYVWNNLVTALAFSLDGAWLACGYGDGRIRLWDRRSGSVRTLEGHESGITRMAWDPDGGRLLSGDEKGLIMEWSVDDGTRLASHSGLWGVEQRAIVSLLPMGERRGWWAFAADGASLIHDAAAGESTITRFGNSPAMTIGRAIMGGDLLALSTFSNIIVVPDIHDPANLVSFPGHEYSFHAVEAAIATDGFAAGSLGTRVMVFDGSFRRSALLGVTEATSAALGISLPSHIAFHPRVDAVVTNDAKGRVFLSRTDGRKSVPMQANVWDIGTASPLLFAAQAVAVIGVDILGQACMIDLETGRKTVLAGLPGAGMPDCTALLPGIAIAGAYPDGRVTRRAWDGVPVSMDARIPGLVAGDAYLMRGIALDPAGSRLASVDCLGFLKIWDERGECRATRACFSAPAIADPDALSAEDESAASGVVLRALGWSPTRCVAFSPGGMTLATGSWEGTVRIWSRDGALLRSCGDNSSPVQDLCFSRDGGLLFFVAGDSRIEILNVNNAQRATLMCTSSDWLLYTPDGYWDSSVQGGQLLAMVQGTRAWNIDQFAARTNRPDILLARMGCDDADLLTHYHEQYLKRLRRLGLDEKALGRDPADAPEALVLGSRQEGRRLGVDFRLSSASSDLKSYNIWVNDVPLFGALGRPASGRSVTLHESIDLNPGSNKVEIGCSNLQGVDAFRSVRYARWDGAPDRRLYYLGFGVSRYTRVTSLEYAAKDARDLEALFRSLQGTAYETVITRTCLDEEVSAQSITAAKALLQSARPQDTLVLFVAGHGVHDGDAASTYYFLPPNADLKDLPGTAASFDLLEDLLQGVAPRNKLFLLDTCESGEDAAAGAGAPAAGGQRMASRAIRIVKADAALSPASVQDALAYRDRYIYNDVFRRSGAIVFSSCRGNEVSWEAEEIQNGAFTSVLKACFSDAKADADGDGVLSVGELKAYVTRGVPELVSTLVPWASQHPTVDRDNIYIQFGFPRVRSSLTGE